MLAASVVAALAIASPAIAATPCGKKVLADWFDNGRIDRLYPLNCYEEGIDAIPADIGPYSDAEDVITRALQAALNGNLDSGGPDPSPDDDESRPQRFGRLESRRPGRIRHRRRPHPASTRRAPSSVPIPLLVLGGMSLALLAAGGLGYLSRRRQAANGDDAGDDTLI